jgi:8-oxo-dGTP pyrophosphatase MutT (NUDIX family)
MLLVSNLVCLVYNVTMIDSNHAERKKTLSCGGLPWRLADDGIEVLLIKQFANRDSWGIPKGHIHSSESAEECAVREIKEETGIDVQLGQCLPDVYFSWPSEDKTVKSWLATPVGSHETTMNTPGNEVADARWFNIKELPTIHLYQRTLITKGIELIISNCERSSFNYEE